MVYFAWENMWRREERLAGVPSEIFAVGANQLDMLPAKYAFDRERHGAHVLNEMP